jgi:hypothetical protein
MFKTTCFGVEPVQAFIRSEPHEAAPVLHDAIDLAVRQTIVLQKVLETELRFLRENGLRGHKKIKKAKPFMVERFAENSGARRCRLINDISK